MQIRPSGASQQRSTTASTPAGSRSNRGRKPGSKVITVDGRQRVVAPGSPLTPSTQLPSQRRLVKGRRAAPAPASVSSRSSAVSRGPEPEELDDDDNDMGDLIVIANSPSPDGEHIIAHDPDPRSRSHTPAPPSCDSSPAGSAQARPDTGNGTSSTQGAGAAGQQDALRATPPLAANQPASGESPTNDIVVVSADGHGFGFRRAYLVTASAKLDRDLRVGAVGRQRTANSGHLLVPVNLSTPHLRRFLHFAHPRVADPVLGGFDALSETLAQTVRLDARPVTQAVLAQGLRIVRDKGPALLALALLFDAPVVAAAALRAFDASAHAQPARWTVEDVPPDLFARLPSYVRELLLHYQVRLLDDTNERVRSWEPLATKMDADPSFLLSATRCADLLAGL